MFKTGKSYAVSPTTGETSFHLSCREHIRHPEKREIFDFEGHIFLDAECHTAANCLARA
jgi:hypothetical protein